MPKIDLVSLLLAHEARSMGDLDGGVAKRRKADATYQPAKAFLKPAKRQKGFDFSRCRQRCIALKIAYFGHGFHGFAAQDDSDNTIEGHLFRALERTCLIKDRATANYSRCGRTDKGVSAFSQVVALHVRSKMSEGPDLLPQNTVPATSSVQATTGGSGGTVAAEEGTERRALQGRVGLDSGVRHASESAADEMDYPRILNGVLPPTIRVLGWAAIPPGSPFSARFSCTGRVYHYFFARHPGLDLEAMRSAARHFEGEHDFRSFCKMDIEHVTHFNRYIQKFDVLELPSGCAPPVGTLVQPEAVVGGPGLGYFRIEGSAFLWHQVRCMVAVLQMVGHGLEAPSIVAELLDISSTPRKPQYTMASELPLVLAECHFENLHWHIEPDGAALAKLQQSLWSHWETHAIHAAVATAGLALVFDGGGGAEQGGGGKAAARGGRSDGKVETPWRSSARHVPLAQRAREDSFEERQKRWAAKSSSKGE